MDSLLGEYIAEDISLTTVLSQLLFALALAYLLRWYYLRYSSSLASRYHLGNMIPLLTGTTFLVIVVVKSSLALSLGLVGALSIVRFRTPIKEPEELVYIFVAIAIGLGMGAGQIAVTVMIVTVLLGTNLIRTGVPGKTAEEYNFVVELPISGRSSSDVSDALIAAIIDEAGGADLSKVEITPDRVTIVTKVALSSREGLHALTSRITEAEPESSCTFFEARPVW